MGKKCLFNVRVFREQIRDCHRMIRMLLWPFYFRLTQCNEGDHSELLQPLCNTQMAVYLPQHTVPTVHLNLFPVWIIQMRLVKNGDFFFFRRRFLLLNESPTRRIKQKCLQA